MRILCDPINKNMDIQTTDVDKILEAILKHKCCICQSPLSVPPIMTTSSQKELYKCGRCKEVVCNSISTNDKKESPKTNTPNNETQNANLRGNSNSGNNTISTFTNTGNRPVQNVFASTHTPPSLFGSSSNQASSIFGSKPISTSSRPTSSTPTFNVNSQSSEQISFASVPKASSDAFNFQSAPPPVLSLSSYRVRMYENVAKHLSFPCRYPKCGKKIPWGKVENHERDCRYRTISCSLFYEECHKLMRVDQLKQHFEEKHKDCVIIDGVVFEVPNQSDNVFLLVMEDLYFFVYVLKCGSIAVLSTQSNKYTKFNVKLMFSTESKFSVSFDEFPVVRYEERSHCFMCVKKMCRQPHHPFSEKNSHLEMNLNSFANKLKNEFFNVLSGFSGNLRFLITLIPDETICENLMESKDDEKEEVDTEEEEEGAHAVLKNSSEINVQAVRKALICPYCLMYMVAPIYSCSTGHSFCEKCKPRLQRCPTCTAPLSDSRNFILEDLAREVEVPCSFDNEGCPFVGNTSIVSKHEEQCLLRN